MAVAGKGCPLVLRLLASSVCVSHKAGKIIREVMSKGDLGIVEKGKNDLQTEADRSAQRCIMASLHKQFPKVALFGEEELDPREQISPDWIETGLSDDVLQIANKFPEDLKSVKDEEIVVWVDPLDGTSEYTQAAHQLLPDCISQTSKKALTASTLRLLDHVTVLIGIAVKGKAVAGVVYQPYYNYQAGPDATLGRVIWGLIGVGSFGYTQTVPPEGQNIITTTRSHSNRTVVEAVEACEPSEVIRVGGAGHKVLLLLEGKAHAYVFASPGCKKWDTAAPEAVLHAAGGKLTDIHGNSMQYHHSVQRRNTGGVLATQTVAAHDWYAAKIPESVKTALPST